MNKSSFKEYLIELIIVIIGITVAFSLNNMAEAAKERRLEKKYLSDIRSDLQRDSANLAYAIKFNSNKTERLEKLIQLTMRNDVRQHQDSLMGEVGVIGNYYFFFSESFTLSSLLQSGDFKLITSDELKKELLRMKRMYDLIEKDQGNFLKALDENYYPLLMGRYDMITNEMQDPEFFYGVSFKNWAVYAYQDTNNMNGSYQNIIKQVQKVSEMIRELEE